ncbi:MAG TPA: hypothetical protein VJX67_06410, partial [Blastocatellia bacterium]|nr:hypothetical protein [Blastocatellia bacterium]
MSQIDIVSNKRSTKWLIAILLVASTVLAYSRVKDLGFVEYDDGPYVTENLHVQTGLEWKNVQWAFTATHDANWHPLTWISHMLDCQLYGLNPAGHHVTNLLIHVLDVLVLFWLLLSTTGAVWRSGLVAALFALHPLNVESVAWVAERKNVLSTLFLLLTVCAYVSYTRRPGVRRYLLVVLMFVMGLMSKPMLVTLPFALFLLDYWPLERV